MWLGGSAIVLWVVCVFLKNTPWYDDFFEWRKATARRNYVEAEQFKLTKAWQSHTRRAPDEMVDDIRVLYKATYVQGAYRLREAHEQSLLQAIRITYASFSPKYTVNPLYFDVALTNVHSAFTHSLTDFANALGHPIAQRKDENNPKTIFTAVTHSHRYTFINSTEDFTLTPHAQQAYEALAAPFKTSIINYEHLGTSKAAYGPPSLNAPTREETKDQIGLLPLTYDGDELDTRVKEITRDHDKQRAEAKKHYEAGLKNVNSFARIFIGTPYWHHIEKLYPNFDVHEPIIIPPATRFAGTWIVAPPGRGKTNLLHHLVNEHRTDCSTIIMDSKGDLLNYYRGIKNVVLIDPRTVQINPLQLGSSTRSLEFLEYIFSALLDTAMTPLQKTLFRTILALLLKIPNATIETFRQILTSGWKPYQAQVMQLSPIDRDFFIAKNPDFDSSQYQKTKQEVLWRLRLLLSNDYLQQIFTSPTTTVDFPSLVNKGTFILIDNSKDILGEEGAEFFGRFFIAMIWMAAVSRSKMKPEDKRPVYFFIDECHSVIRRDDKIATILDECRSQKIALIMAHQRIAQITSANVLDALGNCAIRIANSDDDAASLAPRFRTDPKNLRMPIGQFALFVRDTTPNAVTVNVDFFDVSKLPPAPEPEPFTPPPPPPSPDDDKNSTPPPEPEKQPEPPPQPDPPPDENSRYDRNWTLTLNPIKARDGTVMSIKLPSGKIHLHPIPAGTKNGYRFCLKGMSGFRRPDGTYGDIWIELEIPDFSGSTKPSDPPEQPKKDDGREEF